MRTTLIETSKHYVPILVNLNRDLYCIQEDTPEARTLAEHTLLQIKHYANSALMELRYLPKAKE